MIMTTLGLIGTAMSLAAKGTQAGGNIYHKSKLAEQQAAQQAEESAFERQKQTDAQRQAAQQATLDWKERLRQNMQRQKQTGSARISDILNRVQGAGASGGNDSIAPEPRENLQDIAGVENSDIAGYKKGGIV